MTGDVSKKKLDALMKKLDTDGDGQITLEEFRVLFKEMSTKWDESILKSASISYQLAT